MDEPKSDSTLLTLDPPECPRVRFARNLIRIAVCELRFPTSLQLETAIPASFQSKLRKNYPLYEAQQEITLDPNRSTRNVYLFKSKKNDWIVQLKSDSLVLESHKYSEFEEFLSRLKELVSQAAEITDTDFYTRIGLRYINDVPLPDGNPRGWLNPILYSVLDAEVLGTVDREKHEYSGRTYFGGFQFRHGPHLGALKTTKNEDAIVNYVLDFDYWQENIDAPEMDSFLIKANEINFKFFRWCLAEEAIKWMGEQTPK